MRRGKNPWLAGMIEADRASVWSLLPPVGVVPRKTLRGGKTPAAGPLGVCCQATARHGEGDGWNGSFQNGGDPWIKTVVRESGVGCDRQLDGADWQLPRPDPQSTPVPMRRGGFFLRGISRIIRVTIEIRVYQYSQSPRKAGAEGQTACYGQSRIRITRAMPVTLV